MKKIPKITNVNISFVSDMPRLKGYATITLDDCVLLKDIKIIKTRYKYCIAFPKESQHSPELIVPLNSEVREYFEYVILKEFFERRESDELS